MVAADLLLERFAHHGGHGTPLVCGDAPQLPEQFFWNHDRGAVHDRSIA
ncbi:MAG TPA: hypothetical protein VJY65_13475 [Chloroflexota bacterium]|nr:hypothetical protein [Chloroflexota bacterium]